MIMKKKKKLSPSKMEKLCFLLILFFLLQMALVLFLKGYFPPGSTATTYIHRHYHHLQVVDHRKWKMTRKSSSSSSSNSLSVVQDKVETGNSSVKRAQLKLAINLHSGMSQVDTDYDLLLARVDDHTQQNIQRAPRTIATMSHHPENPIEYPAPVQQSAQQHLADPITCDRSNPIYDWCRLKLPTVLDPATATLSVMHSVISSSPQTLSSTTERIRPYPRKTADTATLSTVREITLTTNTSNAECQFYHKAPALVFSVGGFTGNFFHDFNDGFIPLFVTVNTHFQDRDINLVITDSPDWWYDKYRLILPRFTTNPVINLDNQTTAGTHCFPSAVVGLITHGPMTVRPVHLAPPNRKNLLDFRSLLDDAYRDCLSWPVPKLKGRPRLLVVSREGAVGRILLNQEQIVRAAQEEGFDVMVFKPNPSTDLCQVYKLVNTSQVMVGVHGAALTHSLFLRPGSVLIQVVPLGIDWLAQTYYGNLAVGIKLEYEEYNVKVEESTLADKYDPNSRILMYPVAVASRNWSALNDIYLRGQDVRLDVGRFREYLKRAFFKAKKSMEQQGFNVRRRRGRMTRFVQPRVFT